MQRCAHVVAWLPLYFAGLRGLIYDGRREGMVPKDFMSDHYHECHEPRREQNKLTLPAGGQSKGTKSEDKQNELYLSRGKSLQLLHCALQIPLPNKQVRSTDRVEKESTGAVCIVKNGSEMLTAKATRQLLLKRKQGKNVLLLQWSHLFVSQG